MGLITNPPDQSSGAKIFASIWNTLKNTIYNEFNGNIDFNNLKAAAALRSTQLADTALVAGNTISPGAQTPTRKTNWSAGSLAHDAGASNRASYAAGAYAAGVLTLTPNLRFHYFNVNDATAYNISSIVGSGAGFAAGDEIVLIARQAGAGSVTMTHTDANTVNTIKFRGAVVPTCATTKEVVLGTFTFGSPTGEANNAWYQS